MRRALAFVTAFFAFSQLPAQEMLEELGDNEGYLLVGIEVTGGGDYDSINIDRRGTLNTSHYFKKDELEPGMNFKLIKLKAGTYFFERVNLPYNWILKLDKEAYEMTVEPGVINYGGTLYAEILHNNARARMRNRATAALQHLADCCRDLLARYPVQVSRSQADPFVEYIYEMADGPLYREAAATADEQTVGEVPEQLPDELPTPADNLRDDLAWSLFRRSNVSNATLSPDGKMVAYFDAPDNDRRLVVVHGEQRRKLVLMTEQSGLTLERIFWIDNERIAFEYEGSSETEGVALATLKFDDNGLLVERKLDRIGDDLDVIDPLPNHDKMAVVFGYTMEDYGQRERRLVLRKIDVTDPNYYAKFGWGNRVERKLDSSWAWQFDAEGDIRLLINREPKSDVTESLWWDKDDRKWRRLWKHSPKTTFVPYLLADDGRAVIAASNASTDNTVLAKFDVESGEMLEIVHEVPGADIDGVMLNPRRDRVVSVSYVKDGLYETDYLESPTDLAHGPVDPMLEGRDAYVIDLSFGEDKALVRTMSTSDAGEVYILDLQSGKSDRIGAVRPWLNDYRLGENRTINSTSTDGGLVESYLTLPQANDNQLPPLVVMPHGGPIAVRDTRQLDYYTQYFSILGYAVLQTNYRGSSGFGKSFREKGEGQWGRLIEDDIESAVAEVIDQGLIDPDRICIFGASYGGYSALISAVRRPDLYKCAASFAGVTDLALIFHRWSLMFDDDSRALLEDIVGDPETDVDTLARYSPTFLADQIEIPVLLAHGTDDEIVDMEHFYRMQLMLDHYGKDAEYMIMEDSGHGFGYIEEHQLLLRTVDDFLRKSLGLEPPAADQILTPEALEKRQAEAEAAASEEAQDAA